MKKHLSKNARDFIILLIATPIMMSFGLDLVIALPMLAVYVMQWWLEVRYPKHEKTIKVSSILAIMLFIAFSRLWVVWLFDERRTEVCGTLIKSEFWFFRSPWQTPNVMIDVNGKHQGFYNNTNITPNHFVCVDFIDSRDTIWLTVDYVLNIKTTKPNSVKST